MTGEEGRDADARRFIRLALVVDDWALPPVVDSMTVEVAGELETPAVVDIDQEPGEPSAPAIASLDLPASGPQLESGSTEREHGLRTRVLVETFAEESIGCAVLAPSATTPDDRLRVVHLALVTDILILDWLLTAPQAHQETGPGEALTSLDFVRDVVLADEADGGRLRLICIYTSQDPATVVAQLRAGLSDLPCDQGVLGDRLVVDASENVISTNRLRIRVVSKSRRGPTGAGIPEEQLPGLLIEEFATFAASGLMPRLAIAAVAAVRRHTHRLLLRFDRELDPAFIGHRALTGAYAAEQYALALVGDELTSLLAATHVDQVVHDDRVEARAEELMPASQGDRRIYNKPADRLAPEVVGRSEALRFLTQAVKEDTLNVVTGNPKTIKDYVSVTSLMFDPSSDPLLDGRESDERFGTLGALSRSAAFDGSALPPPTLSLGTVVFSDRSGRIKDPSHFEYWVCVQPLCDSVRLKVGDSYLFPWLPLGYSADPTKFQLLVDHPSNGQRLHLTIPEKRVTDLHMKAFAAGPRGVVEATWENVAPQGWRFIDKRGRPYRWLGDLRVEQAHRASLSIADMLARPGLDEAEYVRQRARNR
jgi:hypothetical protein